MGLKNTKDVYGSVAKWFHCLTAFCFLMLYVTNYYRNRTCFINRDSVLVRMLPFVKVSKS